MSESFGVVIKLLNSLVSPKACLKYLLMALSLLLFWRFLEPYLKSINIIAEHKSLILLLVAGGTGALAGEFVGYVLYHLNEKRKEKKIKKEKEEKTTKERDIFLKTFELTHNYLYDEQIDLLNRLRKSHCTIDISFNKNKALLENNYIICLQKIFESEYIVAINPLIEELVKNHCEELTGYMVEDFLQSSHAEKILQFMENDATGTNSKISKKYIEELAKNPLCLAAHYSESENGYYLYFEEYFQEYLEKKNGVKYNKEIFLSNNILV